jgi:hypothetical protein
MTNVYQKFGVDKRVHSTERWEYLRNEVCPVVDKLIGKNTRILDSWPKNGYISSAIILSEEQEVEQNEKVEEDRGEKVEDDQIPNVDERILALVIYDENQLSETKTEVIMGEVVPDSQGGASRTSGTCGVISCLLVVVALIGLAGVVYWATHRPSVPKPTPVVATATMPKSRPTPTSFPTQPQLPTSIPPTEVPQLPTSTVPPPTAVFVPPANGILFQDNFNNGISSEWKSSSTDWIVSNGQLTLSTNAAFNHQYNWMILDHPEWKNYTLSLDVTLTTGSLSAFGSVPIAVRWGSQGKSIGVLIDQGSNIYWAYLGSSDADSSAIAGRNHNFYFPQNKNHVDITVQGNNYAVQVNGKTIQSVSVLGYDSGGIALGTECEYIECPRFGNVKVTYLP